MSLPCIRVEETVLDLIQSARTFDDAFAWLCRATGRRRTTGERLLAAMARRKKMRWRADVMAALGDVGTGILSLLERRYAYNVERAHGLPAARRQARVRQRTGNVYLDNWYEEYRLCVELDGTAAHPADEQWRDKRRDNWNLVHADVVTLRFDWSDVTGQRCQTASDVAVRLRRNGWRGHFRPCPRCPPLPPPPPPLP
jgi:very-short-patch-repair endonuclease